MRDVYIYGDSLLKATVPDAELKYHFHLSEIMARYPSDRVTVTNRSKMGATVSKGLSLVEHDAARGLAADYALICYGGNDSDYDWADIAANPEGDHQPHTKIAAFRRTLNNILELLRQQGVQPVLMSLPPIDPRRYLRFICRNGLDRNAIMRWLGDEDMIYRHQELYSDTVTELAYAGNVPLIHVRQEFLADHHMNQLLAADGIHMTMEGYGKLFDTLADWLREKLD